MTTPRPTWALIFSIVFLLWSLMGLWAFYSQASMTAETMAALPQEQQAIWAAMPTWLWWDYAVAVGAGFAGAVLLLLRKALSAPSYLVSLIAIVIQFGYVFVATPMLTTIGPSAIVFPLFIFALGAAALWFARYARGKNWIV